MNLSFYWAKIKAKFSKDKHETMAKYFRSKGIRVGEGCNIISDITSGEPYLISIGNETTVSSDVVMLTHDASVGKIFGKEQASDVFGEINIGSNCFIGARTTILYGVSLADNIIVAAGSVVTKSFEEEYVIIGGNPARVIGTWEKFKNKVGSKVFSVHGKPYDEIRKIISESPERLIVR